MATEQQSGFARERSVRRVSRHGTVLMIGTAVLLAACAPAQSERAEVGEAPDVFWSAEELAALKQKLHDGMDESGGANETLVSSGNHAAMLFLREESADHGEVHVRAGDFGIVRSGEGSVLVGGALVDARSTGPDQLQGSSIEGGAQLPLKEGDLFYIPANTPHLWQVSPGRELFVDLIKIEPKDAAADHQQPLHWSAERLSESDRELRLNLDRFNSNHEDLSTADAFTAVLVYRSPTATSEVEVHERLADFHLVRRGEGTMVFGGNAIGARSSGPGEWRGTSIEGGARQPVKTGDLLYVPPGVPHQFQVVPGQEFDVLVVKLRALP